MTLWEDPDEVATVKVAIAGDFLPDAELHPRDVQTCAEMAECLRPALENAEITFLNLECPIDVHGLQPAKKSGLGDTLSAPTEVLHYLRLLRVVPVALANNHVFDYGAEGVSRTRAAILANGMVPLGAGHTLTDAPEVVIWQSERGTRVGFWSCAKITFDPATAARRGTEVMALKRGEMALRQLAELGAHCCVALCHAGLERTNYPEPEDVALMDSLAHAGFSVVAACHSHRISGYKLLTTRRGTSICFYGLGSISSGMMYSHLEREGIVAVVSFNATGGLIRAAAHPVELSDSGWGITPEPRKGETILSRFHNVSTHISDGTYRSHFYHDIRQGLYRGQLRDLHAAFRRAGFRGALQKIGRVRIRHIGRVIHTLFQ